MVGGCRLWFFGWNADIVCLFIPHKYQQTTKQPITNKITKPQNNQKPNTKNLNPPNHKNHDKKKANRRMRA